MFEWEFTLQHRQRNYIGRLAECLTLPVAIAARIQIGVKAVLVNNEAGFDGRHGEIIAEACPSDLALCWKAMLLHSTKQGFIKLYSLASLNTGLPRMIDKSG